MGSEKRKPLAKQDPRLGESVKATVVAQTNPTINILNTKNRNFSISVSQIIIDLKKKMKKEDKVTMISAEGFEFVIDKEAAMVSQTIRNMLTSPGSFSETQLGQVTFPEISTVILEKICQYFYWALQYANGKETEFPIEPELTLELMMAANYLHT